MSFGSKMISVWVDGSATGAIERHQKRGTSFAYRYPIPAELSVSVTMPVRLPSWSVAGGLLPIFEMNLPEGVMRERLRLSFAKVSGIFDDVDLLAIVGRSQLGRIRYSGLNEELENDVPFQSVDELLSLRSGSDIFNVLLERYAAYSGISGVQPKFLIRDDDAFRSTARRDLRLSPSYRGATHIVKFWNENEFPELAANEYFCLRVAEHCGLQVPNYRLSQSGQALIVDRFDLRADGTYKGFEDFCVLNGRGSAQKYAGSYETHIVKRFYEFARSPNMLADAQYLFMLIVLNCALRNGDAHLKNFAILYDDVLGHASLSPVYDIVTTTVYLPQDQMALTLNGTTRWPSSKDLRRLGESRISLAPAVVTQVFARVDQAVSKTKLELQAYMQEHPAFRAIGTRMLEQWEIGVSSTLIS